MANDQQEKNKFSDEFTKKATEKYNSIRTRKPRMNKERIQQVADDLSKNTQQYDVDTLVERFIKYDKFMGTNTEDFIAQINLYIKQKYPAYKNSITEKLTNREQQDATLYLSHNIYTFESLDDLAEIFVLTNIFGESKLKEFMRQKDPETYNLKDFQAISWFRNNWCKNKELRTIEAMRKEWKKQKTLRGQITQYIINKLESKIKLSAQKRKEITKWVDEKWQKTPSIRSKIAVKKLTEKLLKQLAKPIELKQNFYNNFPYQKLTPVAIVSENTNNYSTNNKSQQQRELFEKLFLHIIQTKCNLTQKDFSDDMKQNASEIFKQLAINPITKLPLDFNYKNEDIKRIESLLAIAKFDDLIKQIMLNYKAVEGGSGFCKKILDSADSFIKNNKLGMNYSSILKVKNKVAYSKLFKSNNNSDFDHFNTLVNHNITEQSNHIDPIVTDAYLLANWATWAALTDSASKNKFANICASIILPVWVHIPEQITTDVTRLLKEYDKNDNHEIAAEELLDEIKHMLHNYKPGKTYGI